MNRNNNIIRNLARNYSQKRKINLQNLDQIMSYLLPWFTFSHRVLELGCGSGRILVPLARSLPHVQFTGVDISRDMLSQLSQNTSAYRIRNVTPVLSDINNRGWTQSLPSTKYDTVILFQTIHFIRNLNSLLRQIRPFLHPASQIIISTTTRRQFFTLPYCRIFPSALKVEISRTPSAQTFTRLLSQFGFMLLSQQDFTVTHKFSGLMEFKKWLISKPFSVLSLISPQEFLSGLTNSGNFYSSPFILDKFSVFVFKNTR